MRSQLLVAGLLTIGLGALFYVTALPLVYSWSLPFVIGGVLMLVASHLLKESEGPVQPPPGHRFCAFCSTPVPFEAERCQHCGGLQPIARERTGK
jgi:hypothetical protein